MLLEELLSLKDEKNASFIAKLCPGIDPNTFLGARTPELRKLAKKYAYTIEGEEFIKSLPHEYFDMNMLHGLLISEYKDYDRVIGEWNKFLPYVNNWAVCDSPSPKCFSKNKDKLIKQIYVWLESEHLYTKRFAIGMLMKHYLDEDFKEEYLEIVASIRSEEYYLNMMIAWYFSFALIKQYESTICYIENRRLSKWVHNKTIQKAIESFRIDEGRKEYLRSLRIH